jgi:DNA-directed RNA polymerase subunit N (RpoN/RPB10)
MATWIELEKPRIIYGQERKPGFRCEYPYRAALALVAAKAAFWVDGPHKKSVLKELEPEIVDAIAVDVLEVVAEERESITDLPDRAGFLDLELKDQKEIINALGLDKICDRRKPESMATAYENWLADQ